MNARIRAELAPPPLSSSSSSSSSGGAGAEEEERWQWEREIRQRKAVEERSLTEDLKEKVGGGGGAVGRRVGRGDEGCEGTGEELVGGGGGMG